MRCIARLLALLCTTTAPDVLVAQSNAPVSGATGQGWHFTYTVTVSAAGRSSENGALTLDVAVWHGTARITVREGALRNLTGDRGSILVRGSDSTVVLLNPTRRDALVAHSGELGALLAGGQAGAVPIEVSDVSSVTRARGAATRVLGFSTQRVELEQRYTIQLASPTVKKTLRTVQTAQLDISRDLQKLDAGFRAFAEQFARALELPAAVRAALRAVERDVPDGFPLRSNTAAQSVVGTDTLRTERRAEVTAFNRAAVDTTTFVVPTGYRVTEMSRLLQRNRTPD